MSQSTEQYQKDYDAWAQTQIDLLKAGRFAELDIVHLVEELGDMGRGERTELENRLTVLLAHLLKWEFQHGQLAGRWQEVKGDSWRATIIEQRDRIAKRLDKSPGLKSVLPDLIAEAYEDATRLAANESGLPVEGFPDTCPYAQGQILDDSFFPVGR